MLSTRCLMAARLAGTSSNTVCSSSGSSTPSMRVARGITISTAYLSCVWVAPKQGGSACGQERGGKGAAQLAVNWWSRWGRQGAQAPGHQVSTPSWRDSRRPRLRTCSLSSPRAHLCITAAAAAAAAAASCRAADALQHPLALEALKVASHLAELDLSASGQSWRGGWGSSTGV